MKIRLSGYLRCIFQINWFVFLLITLTLLLLIEHLTYKLNTFNWNQLRGCKNINCQKILLVADPQLIGLQNEKFHRITPLSIWDSDRFLSMTYYYAFKFSQPDIVIFLGDLFDEGSVASEEEFNGYVRRLFNIFLTGSSALAKHIWLPGDNDIGGEGDDFLTDSKIKRFFRAFLQPDIIRHKHLDFYKINMLTKTIPVISDRKDFHNTTRITIGVSHISTLFNPTIFSEKVLWRLQPHLLLSGHNHQSMIITVENLVRNERHITPINRGDGIFEYKLGDRFNYDILVPACSYRMGTTKIGYGYAVIDNNNLQYTVLWSHSRFHQLFFYLVFVSVIFIGFFCKRILCGRRKQYLQSF